ncbi:unnamed protein product [Rotaria sp. Silwood2]|nr:unnamed protein product [Rotaria sp. Silwood2]CAF2752530.1 unnamed protein product [Rotaria sp. Silwood2]CAF3188797.1 unnamed protein product [Rotaria sp. Silwood2]CAF4049361.1 unnamed protein product [Rotaria sp. Silwood2]CAF4110835.1 unnamed protein product [Rotaria sp. Silwood2]
MTGGLFMNVNTVQPNTTREFLVHRLKEVVGYECVLFESTSNRRHGMFMIDQTAISIRIKVVSSSPSLIIGLINPGGLFFRPSRFFNGDYLHMFTIDLGNRSNIGQWMYNCSDDCAVEINIESEFRCRTQVYSPLIDGLFAVIATPPLVNQTGVFAITTCDDSNEILNSSVQLIGTDGKILSNYSMTTPYLVTPITIPSRSFRVRTRIGRRDGAFAYRDERIAIDTSQIVMVIYHQPLVVIHNESLNVAFTIRNDATIPLYIQLNIDDVLITSKWYSISSKSTRDDRVIVDSSRYQLINETTRLVLLAFALQAFSDNNTINPSEVLFRHEQIVAFYIQSIAIHLEAPTHFVNSIAMSNRISFNFIGILTSVIVSCIRYC